MGEGTLPLLIRTTGLWIEQALWLSGELGNPQQEL